MSHWPRILRGTILLGSGMVGGVIPDPAQSADAATIQISSADSAASSAESAQPPPLLRPVALTLGSAGRLLVANRDAGTITCIDTQTRQVAGEFPAAADLADLAATADRATLVTVHSSSAQVRLWQFDGTALHELATLSVPEMPVTVRLTSTGSRCLVSSMWARALSIIELEPTAAAGHRLRLSRTIALPFAPRRTLVLPDERVLVADAFGGQLSVVNVESGAVERTLRIPGHQIRGLELSGDRKKVVIAHQILNQRAETSRDGVFWGIVLTNNLRTIPLENIHDPQREPLEDAYVHFLGDPRAGAGDPSALAVLADGTMCVALGGTNEVAAGLHLDHSFDHAAVGRRPVALAASKQELFVANLFSDSVSVINQATRKTVAEISLREQLRPLTAIERGEELFYDARLSLDGWYSCHSCHTDGHTNGMMNDNLGDGNYGAPKRIPSLFGVRDTAPWLWSGAQTDLSTQIRKSIMTTMQGPEPEAAQIADLAAYVSSLPPPARSRLPAADNVERGQALFSQLGCVECHRPPLYTSPSSYDVGLADQHGRREFNPPSLRGLRLRGPYFHDNRSATLQDVLTVERHQLEQSLTADQTADLICFLESL